MKCLKSMKTINKFKVCEELSLSLLRDLNFEIFEIDDFELSNVGSVQLALYSMEIVFKEVFRVKE